VNPTLKSLQSNIALNELRLKYTIKKLPIFLKICFLILLFLVFATSFMILCYADRLFSVEIPTSGGSLIEGVIGTPRFVNPVLAISDADRDLASLIYSGLMRVSPDGNLIPDLAEEYQISEDGLCYYFKLRENIFWTENHPITSKDIEFTIEKIKDPTLQPKSPKRASFEGVEIEVKDDKNISFCLPHPYSPFLENTTVGILPEHIWGDILSEQMPLSDFNINPIGSGPYKIKKVSRNSSGIIISYTLEPNENFVFGPPYIDAFILKFYPSEKKLIEAYGKGDIESMSAVSPKNILENKNQTSFIKTYPLPRVFATFFNQDNASVFAESEVRQALNLATDRNKIIKAVLKDFGTPIYGPLPPGTLGAPEDTPENNYEENLKRARELLNEKGWKLNEETGLLEKKKSKNEIIKLEFSISTSNLNDLVYTGQLLKEMWENLGAKIELKTFDIGDLEQIVIRPRKYDCLLFGEIMGRDPDPFAFWHSSQRNDPGLNIALYANISVDKLLEEARTVFDPEKRKTKYLEFQKEISKDIPAIFLYSPEFIYLLPNKIKGADKNPLITPPERFSQIYNWHIKTKKIWQIF